MCERLIQGVLVFLCVVVFPSFGQDAGRAITRDRLADKTYSTWEGEYTFSNEQVLEIKKMPPLHLFFYRCTKPIGGLRKFPNEGLVLDFAHCATDGKISFLLEAGVTVENFKGVMPLFLGVDVIVGTDEAEVFVRWRHPGNGGLRSLDKYVYDGKTLRLVGRSDLWWEKRPRDGEWGLMRWSRGPLPPDFQPLAHVAGNTNPLPLNAGEEKRAPLLTRQQLESKAHRTPKAAYRLTDELAVEIEGLTRLYFLFYGALADWGQCAGGGNIRILYEVEKYRYDGKRIRLLNRAHMRQSKEAVPPVSHWDEEEAIPPLKPKAD